MESQVPTQPNTYTVNSPIPAIAFAATGFKWNGGGLLALLLIIRSKDLNL